MNYGPILGDVLLLNSGSKRIDLAAAKWNTVLRGMYKVDGQEFPAIISMVAVTDYTPLA